MRLVEIESMPTQGAKITTFYDQDVTCKPCQNLQERLVHFYSTTPAHKRHPYVLSLRRGRIGGIWERY